MNFGKIKRILFGKERDFGDPQIYHSLALIAFFAWIGLGSDGLSSSCYGPSEVMVALGKHQSLGLFIGLASVITIFVISTSYTQIIELFPHGGGGYQVASKLLSPKVGMVSGSALVIDYVLTIAVSISSGADALFSLLPISYHIFKLPFAIFIIIILIILNMRGVKESVLPLVPIFLIFILTHVFTIIYGITSHLFEFNKVVTTTGIEINRTVGELGMMGTILLLFHAYSMGAGTYTGIEAVSNGLPILREPKVITARKTMKYMAFSLSFMVLGLILSYLLFGSSLQEGKTLNAVLLSQVTSSWAPVYSYTFIIVTLISEGAILFVAAQTGFLDGPRVLANMAIDGWIPNRFASLSERLVQKNGIVLLGAAALFLVIVSDGNVGFLLILYSINVFITFSLSQLGMVKHWWLDRKKEAKWLRKISINGLGFFLTTIILLMVTLVKFYEGGWLTIIITGTIVGLALFIKNEYRKAGLLLKKFDEAFMGLNFSENLKSIPGKEVKITGNKTAILFVNGYSGIGLHSLFTILRDFPGLFSKLAIVEVGIINSGNFKGVKELDNIRTKIDSDFSSYREIIESAGLEFESYHSIGLEVVEEIMKLVPRIIENCPDAIFFGGQIVFPKDNLMNRILHNYTVFTLQRKLFNLGHEFFILPLKV
jgi:amino acid transporter